MEAVQKYSADTTLDPNEVCHDTLSQMIQRRYSKKKEGVTLRDIKLVIFIFVFLYFLYFCIFVFWNILEKYLVTNFFFFTNFLKYLLSECLTDHKILEKNEIEALLHEVLNYIY